MIIGLGMLGTPVLEYLAQDSEFDKEHDRIIACDINENRGVRLVNIARALAYTRNLYPNIEFVKVNLRDIGGTAEVLKSYEPDLIFQNATLMTWWLPKTLPPNIAKKMDEAGIAPFIPCHIALLYKLMLAINRAAYLKIQ